MRLHARHRYLSALAVPILLALLVMGDTARALGPAIVSFSPTHGAPGTSVAITGSGFLLASDVAFNGAKASFTVDSDSQITATVPVGASTGPITVTTPDGTAQSADSFVVPAITSFSPTSGPVGASVAIAGHDFTGASGVAFHGTAASFTVDSDSQITATVPTGATTGAISVATVDGTVTSADSFVVTVAPSVTGFSPTDGPIRTSVVITGSDFAAASSVAFNGTTAQFTVNSPTQITATVPAGATTGPISVTTPDGTATSSDSFVVHAVPAISGFSPSHGPVGTSVTVSGYGFSTTTLVQVGGVSASYVVASSNQLTATVPAGAATGSIVVTTADGSATSAATFVVDKPNILFILTDDQRTDELDHMPTVTSELTQKGVTFKNGFVSDSLCCPSRSTILTGTYSHTTKIYSNTAKYYGGFKYFKDGTTIATVLHAAGYRTGLFGKYLNEYGSSYASYIPPGWDRWFAEIAPTLYFGTQVSDQGTFVQYPSTSYEADIIGAQAVNFIASTPPDQPLFLYFAPHAPHDPATPNTQYAGSLKGQVALKKDASYNEADVSDKPAYIRNRALLTSTDEATLQQTVENRYESLRSVDDWVGSILNALSATGRLQNTLIVYMSDNGYLLGQHRWIGKVVPYEESIKVPFIVRWDGARWGARTDSHIVANVDLAATWAQAAGTTMPGSEGKSLVPLLNDPTRTPWRTALLLEHAYPGAAYDTQPVPAFCGVRASRYVYVQYSTGEEELYDLKVDPHQLTNFAKSTSYASVLTSMRQKDHSMCKPLPPTFAWSH